VHSLDNKKLDIFSFLKNTVCGQITGKLKPKKIPLTLYSPFRKEKDTEKRVSDIGKIIPVF